MNTAQAFMPNALREHLVQYIATQTGVTNPTDIWFAWLGFREGRVAFVDPAGDGRTRRLTVTGDDADALRRVETGEQSVHDDAHAAATTFCVEHFPSRVFGCPVCIPTSHAHAG